MPEKTIIPIINELNTIQKREYEKLWDDYLSEREMIGKNTDIQRDLVELGLLRKYIAMETIPYTIDIANEILSEGNKVIIFTCFTDELMELANYYGDKCVVHYGQLSEKEKQKSIDEFQNREDGPMVFIGNIKSAGVGITLTRSHYLIFNSFNWVPGDVEQAEFRSFRIGQKNNVKIYYNLFKETIITQMWHVLKYKQKIIDEIIGNKPLSENEIMDKLIEKIINENEK
jgi:SWI/SNF-related matrix-associated actin-dependent regulator 1 of chromatin subfamily A